MLIPNDESFFEVAKALEAFFEAMVVHFVSYLTGSETIDVIPHPELKPQSEAKLVITRADGSRQEVTVILRVDTPIEVDYYRNGGILPYVLRQLLAA